MEKTPRSPGMFLIADVISIARWKQQKNNIYPSFYTKPQHLWNPCDILTHDSYQSPTQLP
jgi:hypothetical protein